MPRFPVHTVDDSPADARADLESMQAAMGKVLNIHGGMAHSPVVLAAYRGMGQAITEHGTYDARTARRWRSPSAGSTSAPTASPRTR